MMTRVFREINGEVAAMFYVVCFSLVALSVIASGSAWAATANKLVSVNISTESGSPVLKIKTESPVGYRYTVYDSIDPVRVVIDFPGMDVDDTEAPTVTDSLPVENIKISSFDLTSGKLGRIEIILESSAAYDVALADNVFSMTFEASQPVVTEDITAEKTIEPVAIVEEKPVEAVVVEKTVPETAATVVVSSASAKVISNISINSSSLSFDADGNIEIFKYFKLGAPPRLVVDVYGVKASFKDRKFDLANGFSLLRVGIYKDKTRFVFDADGVLPEYSVVSADNSIAVAWGDSVDEEVPQQIVASSVSGVPVNIEAIDFDIEDNDSVVRVTLSGSADIIEATLKDGIVGFGIKNASISRALRRAIDASSFPSSIRLITPYSVLVGKSQDVRFAVELKGPSEYSLDIDDNVVTLKVINGPFAEPEAPVGERVAVDLLEDSVTADTSESVVVTDTVEATQEVESAELSEAVEVQAPVIVEPAQARMVSASREIGYAGQRISLVFDNANIRNILQLIAEVSNLNILAGDGVDGTITLRLIDVPWDQALDLILETKDLGMIRDGNVARILPKESIRAMDEAKFSAARTKEKLEDVITEVITVSYTDLKNISGPSRELLTERGKITEDNRNKQIIVTDIPKVIDEIRNLVSILDTPEKQVLIEARIVEVSTTANLDLGVNWNIFYSQDASFDPTSANQTSQVGLGGNFVVPAFAAGTGASAGMGGEFSWGKVGVNTTILDLRLSALETAGEGQIVSNPRIMTLNGEKAKISQGTMIPYQTVSADEIKTELIEAALSLEVTPIINPDNTIILDIKATNSSPGTTVATGAGAAPSIDTKEAQTKMLVKDGETMVIGGIYVEKDDFSENGVPILMHIPFIGNLFKSTKVNKNRTELMIFITPRIIE